MNVTESHPESGSDSAQAGRPPLTFDLDADVVVVGAGVAGLTVALEAAKGGASVAVLESRQVGWGASGHNLGSVMPGFGIPISELIDRVGFDDARALWALAQEGGDYIRARVKGDMPGLAMVEGALEVSNTDIGEQLISRLQVLGEDFGTEVEGWQLDRVRDVLSTGRYFHAIHFPRAFQIDGAQYVRRLAELAEQHGVRIFESTPVTGLDPSGVRKRVIVPTGRLRCYQVVLAGNVHIGVAASRLAGTLLPIWRYMALSEPLGERLGSAINFQGSIMDTDAIDHFRVVEGDRLLWSSRETTWQSRPDGFAKAIQRRIATVFPALGAVKIDKTWGAPFGQTVHGMPQIGELQAGLWVASGFGRQGLNTSAMAGQLIARSMQSRDDRWKLFSPFELVWTGGPAGRVVGQGIGVWSRCRSGAAGALARYRERVKARERVREARLTAANARTGARRAPPANAKPSSDRQQSPSKSADT